MPVITTPDGETVIWESMDILEWLEGAPYAPKPPAPKPASRWRQRAAAAAADDAAPEAPPDDAARGPASVAGFDAGALPYATAPLAPATQAQRDVAGRLLNASFGFSAAAGSATTYAATRAVKLRALEAGGPIDDTSHQDLAYSEPRRVIIS